jgi:hypothetical protein
MSPRIPALILCFLGFLSAVPSPLCADVGALTPALGSAVGIASGLSGRVVDARSHEPLSGASVSIPGAVSRLTDERGCFSFTGVSVQSGTVVTVMSGNYYETRTVTVPVGTKTVDMGDISMGLLGAVQVTEIKPQYDGFFLQGVALSNRYTAHVNWGGRKPGTVKWYVNGVFRTRTEATGNEVSVTFNMGTDFSPRLLTSSVLEAVALVDSPPDTARCSIPVRVLPISAWMSALPGSGMGVFTDATDVTFSYEGTFPTDPAESSKTLPFLGQFGADFSLTVGMDYTLSSGEWTLSLGAKAKKTIKAKPSFIIGKQKLTFGVEGSLSGVANLSKGLKLSETAVVLTMNYKGELMTFYFSDYVPGGQWARAVDKLAQKVGLDPNSIQRVRLYALVDAKLKLVADLDPAFQYKDGTLKLGVGLEAAYEPDLGLAKLVVRAGGRVDATISKPSGGSLSLKKIEGKIYAAIKAEVLSMEVLNEEFVLLNYEWNNTAAGALEDPLAACAHVEIDGVEYVAVPVVSLDETRPAPRPQLARGPERFVNATPEAFRQLGGPSVLAGASEEGAAPERAAGVSQVDVELISNAYPTATPALSAHGNELMLLHVTDNGGADLQYTDIAWSHFDGSAWSMPAPIATDTRAEFAPQVRFDGNGDAIAVWQRVKDPAFATVDLTAMAEQMEIVWAKWDRATGVWTTPAALTDNAYLDQSPQLCGPMTGGDLLLVWTANEASQLTGTGEAGATTNSRFMSATWNAASGAWGSPAVLLDDVRGEMSPVLAGRGDRAVLAWSRDGDADVSATADAEIVYCEWNAGAWGAPVQWTSNVSRDTNVRAAVTAAGDVHLVWHAGADLMWTKNFGAPTLVRSESDTAGFADYSLTVGPQDHLVLLWLESSASGSDTHYRVYDPVSSTWGLDDLFTRDAALERSLAPVWDSAGNLTIAYLKVQMEKATKSVTLADGSVLTVDNVPENGQVDLYVSKRILVQDAALETGALTVEGSNYLPGDALTLKVRVRNAGNVAIDSPKVAFYQGDPASGGSKIGEAESAGWLAAAGEVELSTSWVLPDSETEVELYAVLDPEDSLAEFSETNNRQQMVVGGTDLDVSYRSCSIGADGSMRIVASVQNLGMPGSPATTLQVSQAGGQAVLGQVAVPALAPGEIAQVALDLPAGSHPGGEVHFVMTVDPALEVDDVSRENNQCEFAAAAYAPTLITVQPEATETRAGETATFRVNVASALVLSYQWQVSLDGGATWIDLSDTAAYAGLGTDTLTVLNPTAAMQGQRYRCVISDATGNSFASVDAPLSVQWSQFAALSARASSGPDDQTLILGFAFSGGGKAMLLRGVGPGLSGVVSHGYLADPQLRVFSRDGVEVVSNDNWSGGAGLREAFARTGAGALDPASRDAALLQTLTEALYTAHVSDVNGTTGVALAEAYDADFADKTRRLTALSVRTQVGLDDACVIAGLVIAGDAPKRVIVRGVGPGVADSVAGHLADPYLHVRRLDAATGEWTLVGENDDWDGTAPTAALFESAGMGALASGSKDAALVLTLEPGIYTIEVTGVERTTGVALVEIYEAP